jgi:hypothetical protein
MPPRGRSWSRARGGGDGEEDEDFQYSAVAQVQEQMRAMQEQLQENQERMEQMMILMSKSQKATEVESKQAEELRGGLKKQLIESERKRVAAENARKQVELLATAGSGGRVVIHEELSVRREYYQARLRDLSKIKKDGSNYELWRKQFEGLVYVAKWDRRLFDLNAHQ